MIQRKLQPQFPLLFRLLRHPKQRNCITQLQKRTAGRTTRKRERTKERKHERKPEENGKSPKEREMIYGTAQLYPNVKAAEC